MPVADKRPIKPSPLTENDCQRWIVTTAAVRSCQASQPRPQPPPRFARSPCSGTSCRKVLPPIHYVPGLGSYPEELLRTSACQACNSRTEPHPLTKTLLEGGAEPRLAATSSTVSTFLPPNLGAGMRHESTAQSVHQNGAGPAFTNAASFLCTLQP